MYYKEDDEIVRYENGEDITKKERVENYKKYKCPNYNRIIKMVK